MNTPSRDKDLIQFLNQTFAEPGAGVFTVHTGQDKRIRVLKSLYGSDLVQHQAQWKESLQTLGDSDSVLVYGIPSDCGGGIQRGANWGPLAIREVLYTHLKNSNQMHLVLDLGDVRVNPHLLQDELLNVTTVQKIQKAMYADAASDLQKTLPVSPLSIAAQATKKLHVAYPDKKLLMLGGDHSVSYPAVTEYLKHKSIQGISVGVIHFDAHTDLLIDRMGIPICFGSWTSHALKHIQNPADWIQIGIRASGKSKLHWEETFGLQQFWSDECKSLGAQSVAESIIQYFNKNKIKELYITFDIDAIDADEAAATGTPEPNGLQTDFCIDIIERLSAAIPITGADLVEVAPFVRHPDFLSNDTLKSAEKVAYALLQALKH
jgi:agmatinase